MIEALETLKINATNGKECFCYINEKQLGALKQLAKREKEEIEQLNNDIKILLQESENKENIINELEKYTIENIEVLENRLNSPFCNFEKATKELSIFQNYLDKLKELKESGNNE